MAAARRLAAIMFTDMVGFTASAQIHEAAALKLLQEQEKLVRPVLAAHHGREIKSTGDGFLVEFGSALQAIECAIEIQRRLHKRNSQSAVGPIELRIGLHLGDIERRRGDVFGDAVNVASRIGPCAVPGGICISGPVFDQVRNKIPHTLEKLEARALKNVRFPVDIYRVVLPWKVSVPPAETSSLAGLAVLPFANISPDPKDEYFADGLTEELITVLSQLRGLRVIARTSVIQYKSTTKPVSQIGSELGVSSVLEGSVRKAGNRLRITVQLIDVSTQGHAWANTYDRELADVFAVQAEIAKQVSEALKIEMLPAEEARLKAKPRVRPESYMAYLKGRTLMSDWSESSQKAAQQQFELAVSLDGRNAAAYAGLGDTTLYVSVWNPRLPRAGALEACRALVARATELDPNLAEAQCCLGEILWGYLQYAAAEKQLKLAISLNPSYSWAHYQYGMFLQDEDRADEALRELAIAEGADPFRAGILAAHADLLIWLGRLDEAKVKIERLGQIEGSGQAYHYALARYYLAQSDFARFRSQVDQFEPGPEESSPRYWPLWRDAFCAAVTGQPERAKEFLRELEALPPDEVLAINLAQVYGYGYGCLSDLDGCFRWLEKAVQDRRIAFREWRMDPLLEPVRKDPRFRVLLKQMNLA